MKRTSENGKVSSLLGRQDQNCRNGHTPVKVFYRFNAVPVKIPKVNFTELVQTILIYIHIIPVYTQKKRSRTAKAILHKSRAGGFAVPDSSYRAKQCW